MSGSNGSSGNIENVDDFEDHEEWNPDETSWTTHLVAGSTAGLAEHILVFPIDTLKTHLQSGFADSKKLKRMVKTRGFKRLMRGSSTMISGCIPAHGLYFSIYEVRLYTHTHTHTYAHTYIYIYTDHETKIWIK